MRRWQTTASQKRSAESPSKARKIKKKDPAKLGAERRRVVCTIS